MWKMMMLTMSKLNRENVENEEYSVKKIQTSNVAMLFSKLIVIAIQNTG